MGTWIEIYHLLAATVWNTVVPLVGTWIEIEKELEEIFDDWVVPLVGTWIEIFKSRIKTKNQKNINGKMLRMVQQAYGGI